VIPSNPKDFTRRSQRTISLALAAVAAVAVAIGSFLPQEDKQALHSHGRFHSLGHLLVFMVIGYLGAMAVRSRGARILVFCGLIAFGAAIEYGEHIVFHGSIERKDILVDALGVVAGTLVAIVSTPRE
jgi:uncharacterized membrane protein